MNSLWDIRIFLGLVPKESHCIRYIAVIVQCLISLCPSRYYEIWLQSHSPNTVVIIFIYFYFYINRNICGWTRNSLIFGRYIQYEENKTVLGVRIKRYWKLDYSQQPKFRVLAYPVHFRLQAFQRNVGTMIETLWKLLENQTITCW